VNITASTVHRHYNAVTREGIVESDRTKLTLTLKSELPQTEEVAITKLTYKNFCKYVQSMPHALEKNDLKIWILGNF